MTLHLANFNLFVEPQEIVLWGFCSILLQHYSTQRDSTCYFCLTLEVDFSCLLWPGVNCAEPMLKCHVNRLRDTVLSQIAVRSL